MKSLTFGEVVSFLLPGGTVVLGVSMVYPELRAQIGDTTTTLPTIAMFLILSYTVGHLVQAFGEVTGRIYWKMRGGFPTDWVRTREGAFLSASQMETLDAQWRRKLGLLGSGSIKELKIEEWHSVIQQMYAAISARARGARLDVFTGNLLLNRGMAAACFILTFMAVESLLLAHAVGAVLSYSWNIPIVTVAAMYLFFYRMGHFAKRYANELLTQFIQLPEPRGAGSPKK